MRRYCIMSGRPLLPCEQHHTRVLSVAWMLTMARRLRR